MIELSATERLAAIGFKWNLPNGALKEIGKLLREHGAEIPVDARTIIKTDRVKPTSDNFHYFGLLDGIIRKLESGHTGNNI